jgi:adenosylcobinamide kinase/adenosylcobinamide-phosphate guanylyltransferase
MGRLTMITGGARSGKSTHALVRASTYAGPRAYVATAEALDEEMRARINAHKAERGGGWETFEEPLNLADLLHDIGGTHDVILIDCLTLWLSNVMLKGLDPAGEAEALVEALSSAEADVFVVTNEVGMGIVPENDLARAFRDHAGTLNRKVAEAADEVVLTVAGIPLWLKPQ